jgi:dTDP-3-amino-2,3,6-trideoxy-4-keto-D-glucose/dTDP-3-amino-3,4,6-trideoxy-alpha-D-glucose/dTDP-2,6-dideoxy-D-kanosamine transaminase
LSTDRIPLNDLNRQNGPLEAGIRQAFDRVLASGWYLRGSETSHFEAEWATFCGQSHCVSCASGTDALTLAAMALGQRHATIQANTLPLTAIGLHRAGVELMLADVDATGRMATVPADGVPVLLYGRLPTEAEAACRLFDAAHAHGWQPGPQAVACWSFYPTKTLGALGDAGAITTNDARLAAVMRDLAGRDDVFRDGRQMTSRMDEMQAAILRVKLKALPEWIAARQEIGRRYAAALPPSVQPVSTAEGDLQHLAAMRAADRDGLAAHLKQLGIETKIHFPVPLNRQDASWGAPGSDFPGTDAWCASVLTLPCFPGMTLGEVDRVIDAVNRFAEAACR